MNVGLKLFLRRDRRKRLEAGNPWIFRSEVEKWEGEPYPGKYAHVYNHQGVFLAAAYVNPQSQIFARVLSYNPQEVIDEEYFIKRLLRAKQLRQQLLRDDSEGYRLVYGEADGLPGLIVDVYKDVLTVQLLTAGMDLRRDLILSALQNVCQPRAIVWRNDASVRRLEGLSLENQMAYGHLEGPVEILENGLRLEVDVLGGQKTGHFFDQRENRRAIRPYVQPSDFAPQGARMLDCFCHTGAFTVHALAYGASHVTAVDISHHALEAARRNLTLNGWAERAELVEANAFDFLRKLEQDGQEFDVVLLDPPAFAKSRQAVNGALRGYKEINLRGMRLLREGGFLLTCSCSYHVSSDIFQQVVLEAATDAHKILRQIEFRGAGPDHPYLAALPEGNYLKFAVYQVTSRKA
ncbi:class I SAM-dependent rRNA methyltransferase [Alicyclobacillus sp. TC]|uniref:23S rRNA (Cytosine1962-C5)-methyltransferase n=1 Tax=Alicyclobacillus tolerans TaxID=90970 RepID=A0A1M6PPI6_9BACL|nr:MULTISPECIES: class I SAM-dependent rRNA methyltransferase [Alicyclobacillus]QRF24547.1 class I SAM-dependent rRNA methyltransferase [Alicyclobacillus sp. TC]SHK09827.1 23S rRNA (cytosine1962-C5)-methyltransferase [Alicyclobacillus montanus]